MNSSTPVTQYARTTSWSRAPVIHYLLILITVGVLWAGIGFNLVREFRDSTTSGVVDSRNMVRAFSENIIRTIDSIDQTLLLVREAYARDPSGFDLRTWARRQPFMNELTIQIALIGSDGFMLQSNIGPAVNRVDLSDREHFRVHLGASEDRLFISRPVLGRVSNKWTIQFTRKIIMPDGSFGGVFVVSLDPYYLSRFHESLALGNGVAFMAHQDMRMLLAWAPARPEAIGKALPEPLATEVRSAVTRATYTAPDPFDGIERIVSIEKVGQYPLYVGVGLSTDDLLAGARGNRSVFLMVGVTATIGILIIGALLIRQRNSLVHSEKALTATLENMSQGILMIDDRGRVPVVNQRAYQLLGLPQEMRAMGLKFHEVLEWQIASGEFGPPETWDNALARLLRSGGVTLEDAVYERTRPNGTVLEVRTQLLPMGGAVRTFTDITDRKRTETDLARALDAAEAATRARSEFLAVMSHEIRTPLNGILGVSGLLLDMPQEPTARRYLEVIRDSGNHLLQLLNDILDFSKLDAGRMELEEVDFDPRAMIDGARELLATAATEKGLALSVEVDETVPTMVRGDPGRLRQVILNLLGNGIKFTSQGRVSLHVRRRQAGNDNVHLAFEVRDTGIGIQADKIPLLFRQFSQVDSSVSRQFGGTGLGLAICRALIAQMGGHISVESVEGQGSVFRFEVVLARAIRKAAAEAEARWSDPALPRLRVLLAEDNATNRLVVTSMLERAGHRVDSVANGLEAVQAIQAFPYDVVLMDMMMPEMDGLTATREIRALASDHAQVPIVGLTANALVTDREACLAAGMNGFLTKPISSERLMRGLADALAGRTEVATPAK